MTNSKESSESRIDGWIDALVRRRDDGRPAVGKGIRRHAAEQLARVDPGRQDVSEALGYAAAHDSDAAVREQAAHSIDLRIARLTAETLSGNDQAAS